MRSLLMFFLNKKSHVIIFFVIVHLRFSLDHSPPGVDEK